MAGDQRLMDSQYRRDQFYKDLADLLLSEVVARHRDPFHGPASVHLAAWDQCLRELVHPLPGLRRSIECIDLVLPPEASSEPFAPNETPGDGPASLPYPAPSPVVQIQTVAGNARRYSWLMQHYS